MEGAEEDAIIGGAAVTDACGAAADEGLVLLVVEAYLEDVLMHEEGKEEGTGWA